MRRFSSYGPVNVDSHFYVPRTALIDRALADLAGGAYVTVWAPRQCGKSWVMAQATRRLAAGGDFNVVATSLEHLKLESDTAVIVKDVAEEIANALHLTENPVGGPNEFHQLFRNGILDKPLILVLDEFDSLPEDAITALVAAFRRIHGRREQQVGDPRAEQDYLLHGVALIGVRSVLGIDNQSGSPFNVQRSLHIPPLTAGEVRCMFAWYAEASGQAIDSAVIERLHGETQGQPGLTSWLGELLTETHNPHRAAVERGDARIPALAMGDFERMFADAVYALPNASIQNLISKVRQSPYRDLVLDLFQTEEKLPFRFDEPRLSHLYLNGVIDREIAADNRQFVKFSSPFVQKRLFNYFSFTDFHYTGRLFDPFDDLSDTITETGLDVRQLIARYERHLRENRDWLLKDAPRRRDLRIREAVFHFTLYSYLTRFLQHRGGQVFPEFPTGNGQIDLLIRYADRRYGLEVKTYTDAGDHRQALRQAASYARQLGLDRVALVYFIEQIDDANRSALEVLQVVAPNGGRDAEEMDVTVEPMFVQTSQ